MADAVEIEKVFLLVLHDREGGEVVSVIDVLTRANKYAGEDREPYLRKRTELLCSRSNHVVIDLLRGGSRMPQDDMPAGDYCDFVSRVKEWPRAGVWPWCLRDPMPHVPIPLRAGEPDAMLNLKAVLDQPYDAGAYADFCYSGPSEPWPSPDDAAWASQFLPQGVA